MPRPTVMFTLVKYLIHVCNHIGMPSKSKEQIIPVVATQHVLFNIETPLAIPTVISNAAIKAAINLLDVCILRTGILCHRGAGGWGIPRIILGLLMLLWCSRILPGWNWDRDGFVQPGLLELLCHASDTWYWTWHYWRCVEEVIRGVCHKRNLIHYWHKSNWNPETQTEIQRSTLKSRNPL